MRLSGVCQLDVIYSFFSGNIDKEKEGEEKKEKGEDSTTNKNKL